MMKDAQQKGFTLIELMVAMAMTSILIAIVALAFTGQSRSYNTVQDIASLQQDMRSGLQLMAKEIRMAGYNPTGGSGIGILNASSNSFQFSKDINGDGDTVDENEIVRFAPYDRNGDTVDDTLGRATGAGVLQPLAENIGRLAFEYYLDNGTWTQAPADLAKIRAVKVMIMGHSTRETAGVVDNSTFRPPFASAVPPSWTPTAPGRFNWRLMSIIVQCRNLYIKA